MPCKIKFTADKEKNELSKKTKSKILFVSKLLEQVHPIKINTIYIGSPCITYQGLKNHTRVASTTKITMLKHEIEFK